MKPNLPKLTIEQLEDRINLDSSIQFYTLGGALAQTGGRFGTFNLGYFNQGEIITLKSDIPSSGLAGGGVATGLNVTINNTIDLDTLDWIQDIGRYSVINSGNITLSYGVTRTGADEAYGSISIIGKTPAANLKTNTPIINSDGSISYSYQVEGQSGSQIAYRGYVELELYYAVGPNRSDIREKIDYHQLESNPGAPIPFTVPKEVVQNSHPKEPRSHIVAIIDKDDLAAESNPDDNIKAIALPNLVVLPPKISGNGNVNVGYRIEGGPIKTNDISIWLFWSDSKTWDGDRTFIKKIAIDPKAVGDKWIENAISGSQLDSAPSGKPYLLARLDPLGNYVESNEVDNTAVLELPDINLKDSDIVWDEKGILVKPKFENQSLIPADTTATISAYWAKGPKKTDIIDQSSPIKSFPISSKTMQISNTVLQNRPDEATHIVFVADIYEELKELKENNNYCSKEIKNGNLEIIESKTNKPVDIGRVLNFKTVNLRQKNKTIDLILKNTGTPDSVLTIGISARTEVLKGNQTIGFHILSVGSKKVAPNTDPNLIYIRGGKQIKVKLAYDAPIPLDPNNLGRMIIGANKVVVDQDLYGIQDGLLKILIYRNDWKTNPVGNILINNSEIKLEANVKKPEILLNDKIWIMPGNGPEDGVGKMPYPNVITFYKSSSTKMDDFLPAENYLSYNWGSFAFAEELDHKFHNYGYFGSFNDLALNVWTYNRKDRMFRPEGKITGFDGYGSDLNWRFLGPNKGKYYVLDEKSRNNGIFKLKETPIIEGEDKIKQKIKYSVDFDYAKAKFIEGGNRLLNNGYEANWIDTGYTMDISRKITKINGEWYYKIDCKGYAKNGKVLAEYTDKIAIEELRNNLQIYYKDNPDWNPMTGNVFFNESGYSLQIGSSQDKNFASAGSVSIKTLDSNFDEPEKVIIASEIASGNSYAKVSLDSTYEFENGYSVFYKKSSDTIWTKSADLTSSATDIVVQSLNKNTPYQFKVTGILEDGTSVTSDILDVQTEVDPPNFPHDFDTTRILKDAVFLKWTDSSNDETGFRITQSSDNGKTWDDLDLVGKNKTSFKVSDLNPNTDYQFRVYAVNGEVNSDPSRTLKVKTLKDIPKTPENLHFSEIRNNSVVVRWDDKSNDETGFRIAMSSDGGHTWAALPNLAPSTEKYLVTGLKGNRKYQFKVRALGANDASPYTASETIQTDPNPPKAPTYLKVDSPNYNRLNLLWQDNSNDEDQFEISMSSNGGTSWKTIDYVKRDKVSYLVTNLYEETPYQFRIRSIGDGSESAWSEIAHGTTTSSKPDIPADLKASDIDLNSFKLAWKTAKGAISRYEVQILGDEGWQLSENVGKSFTGAKIEFERRGGPKLKPNTQYQVRLVAVSENGRSSDSTSAIFVRTDSTVPAAPENIKVSSITAKTFSLSWSSTSKYVDHFEVYVESGGTWQLSENVNKDFRIAKIEYELAKKVYLKPETDYKVRVRAIGIAPGLDEGPWSEVIEVKTESLRPSVPEGLKFGTVSTNKFEISWKHSGDKLNKFQVQVQTDGVWHISEDVGSSFRGALIEHEVANGANIQSDKTYNVRIRAVNKDGNDFINSDWSEPVTVTTDTLKPKAPEGLKLGTVSTNKFEISWKHSGDKLNKFQVQVQTDGVWHISEDVGSSFRGALIEHEVANGASIQPNKTYNVRIRAVNKDGNDFINGDWSDPIAVTTESNVPETPYSVSVSNIGLNSFNLSWKSDGKNVSKFEVWVLTDSKWNKSEPVGGDRRSALIEYEVSGGSRLQEDTPYSVKIIACNDDANNPAKSAFSESVSLITTTLKPHAPSGLKATTINRTSFVIKWNDNDGSTSNRNETKFEVHISKDGVNYNLSENVPKDRESATIEYEVLYDPRNIKKIKANTKYWVIIYAVNGHGKTLMTGSPFILTTDK